MWNGNLAAAADLLCRRRRGLIRALLVIGCVAAPMAQGAELTASVPDLPPWGDASSITHPGIHVELLREIAARTGHTIEIRIEPYARVIACLRTGRADLTLTAWSDARADYAEQGATALELGFGVIGRAGRPLESYDQLYGLRIATVRGLLLEHAFDKDPKLDRVLVADYRAGLRLLRAGRVDAVVGSFLSLDRLALDSGDVLDGPRLLLRSLPITLQYSRHSLHLGHAQEIDAALMAMTAEGAVQRIVHRYMAGGGLPDPVGTGKAGQF